MVSNFRHQLKSPLDSQSLFFITVLASRYKLDEKNIALVFQRIQKVVKHFPLAYQFTELENTVYAHSIIANSNCKMLSYFRLKTTKKTININTINIIHLFR